MEKRIVVALMLTLLMMGCKGDKATTADDGTADEETASLVEEEEGSGETIDDLIAETPMPTAAEELFDDFFFNFASNKHLQQERIAFPLMVNSGVKVDTLKREDWQMDHFFMPQGEYTLIFDSEEQMEQVKSTAVSEAIVERIFLNQSYVRQYLFKRESGRWMLREIRNQTLEHNPNASFLEFYQRFVSDSLFLHESLNSEIAFAGPDPDDDFSTMEGVITPDFWDAFAPQFPRGVIYNVVYGRQSEGGNYKVFVIRGISNGQEIDVVFEQKHGHWKLTKLSE